mgnify:CR=1 FL=1
MTDNIVINLILEYIIVFLLVFILQYLLFGRKNKKYDKNKVPVELFYLMTIYKIDVKKINYPNFVKLYCLVNTFVISTIYMIVMYLINSWILKVILGIILLILLTIICYGIVARYYKRKGMVKDV